MGGTSIILTSNCLRDLTCRARAAACIIKMFMCCFFCTESKSCFFAQIHKTTPVRTFYTTVIAAIVNPQQGRKDVHGNKIHHRTIVVRTENKNSNLFRYGLYRSDLPTHDDFRTFASINAPRSSTCRADSALRNNNTSNGICRERKRDRIHHHQPRLLNKEQTQGLFNKKFFRHDRLEHEKTGGGCTSIKR